jgi:putative membrane-bound dehydrogenase-like protein
MKKLCYLLMTALFGTVVSCHEPGSKEGIAYDGIKLEKGLKLKLIASEPLVVSPVAFAFNEQGDLYVVEDRGYPDTIPPAHEGRIVRLEDRNGDGVYDQQTVFATGFTYPNGILPWKGGFFVTCAPDIFYLKDTTGDGVADERKVVLTGFNVTKSSQLRVSHPILGLDGWVYITGGMNGGKVVSPEFPGRDTVEFTSSDGRFDPDNYTFELTGGNSQFGLTFDDFGRRFGCSNRHPIQQIVMEPWYLNRNPYLPFNETIQNVSKVEGDAIVYPLIDAVTSSDYIPGLIGKSHKGTFTSACSVLIFDGNGMKPENVGDAFICEPAQNLVQRQKIISDGATFQSELPDKGYEFLASTDPSFRPVFLGNGPGGGLYVADMYRKIIDEPDYVPEDVRDTLDYKTGKDKGRIYEIIREDDTSNNSRKFLKPSAATNEVLEMLKSENGWNRQMAFRLLLEKEDKSTIPVLTEYAQKSNQAATRVLALWLLHSLHGLDKNILLKELKDEIPGVREQAVLLSASKITEDSTLKQAIVSTCTDSSERVRFESALALGTLSGQKISGTLAKLVIQDGNDRWMRAAVLSGVGNRMGAFLTAIQQQKEAISNNGKAYSLVMEDLGNMFGNGASVSECREFLKVIMQSLEDKNNDWRFAAALGMANGLSNKPGFKAAGNNFIKFIKSIPSGSAHNPEAFINEVMKTAKDQESPESVRIKALELLGFFDDHRVYPILEQALQPENSSDIQKSAIEAITHLGTDKGGNLLAGSKVWGSYTPEMRQIVINALVSKQVFVKALMDGIEDSVIAPSDVPSRIRQRLMHQEGDIQKRAEKLFSKIESGDRMQVYEEYKSLITAKKGNAKAGQTVFVQTCSRCHTYAGKGGNVGPDLTDIKDQPAEALLLHILLPNYEVYPQYQTIYIELKDGQFVEGWIVSQKENSITLRTVAGADKTILKSNIKSSINTGKSLMPEGLEKSMTKDGFIDLIAYLKSGGNF